MLQCRHIVGISIIVLLLPVVFACKASHAFDKLIDAAAVQDTQAEADFASLAHLHSSNLVLVKLDGSGEVLMEKHSTDRIYPASMSKIMTAVVTLENLDHFGEVVTLNEQIYAGLYAANAKRAGYLPNEEVPAMDLLYGLMLPSGAECAIGLAEHIAGSEQAFVDMMNQKAAELGMDDTHFANSTGLHDPNHYSTPSDLAILLAYALDNESFYQIFTTSRYTGNPTNLHPNGITLYSSLLTNTETWKLPKGAILGGKTGYTEEAGQCLASLAEIEKARFILVTSGAPGDSQTQMLHIDDAYAVYSMLAQT